MLKYYSYYNVGGYKDMFLGNSSMKVDATYFLPLFQVWKKRANDGDTAYAAKIKEFENLPRIQVLNADSSFGLPKTAHPMFTHGGYKILNTVTAQGESIFAIRDIDGSSKDESGRAIPFLMVIVGDSEEDMATLEKVAAYAASHLETFSNELAAFFAYDSEKNGICFKLSALNKLISRISDSGRNKFITLNGEFAVHSKAGEVSLLLLPGGLPQEIAIREQNLSGMKVHIVEIGSVLPLDNQQYLNSMLQKIKFAKQSAVTNKYNLYLIGGAFALGVMAGYLVAKM